MKGWKIVIGKDGKSLKVDAEGFTGGTCVSKFVEWLEGLGKSTREDKPEMFENGDGQTISND